MSTMVPIKMIVMNMIMMIKTIIMKVVLLLLIMLTMMVIMTTENNRENMISMTIIMMLAITKTAIIMIILTRQFLKFVMTHKHCKSFQDRWPAVSRCPINLEEYFHKKIYKQQSTGKPTIL